MQLSMDGRGNKAKKPELERRAAAMENAAVAQNNLTGKIKITPEYIAKDVRICKFLGMIEVFVVENEANPQVAYKSIQDESVPITSDLDLLA